VVITKLGFLLLSCFGLAICLFCWLSYSHLQPPRAKRDAATNRLEDRASAESDPAEQDRVFHPVA
jgi:hypothetical protein